MKTVLKYPVAATGSTVLTLREGFTFVRFEYVMADKALYAWFEEPLKADTPQCQLELKVIHTGDPIQDSFSYLSTALDPMGPETYHLYRLKEAGQTGQHDGGGNAAQNKLKRVA